MTSTSLQSITRSIAAFNWAAALERTARLLAIAIAFTYAAGLTCGTFIHQASAALAAFSQELQQEDWHTRRLAQLRSHLLTPPSLPPAPTSPQPVLTAAETPPAATKRSMRKRSRSSSNPSAAA
jgi:hypothetical protein